MPYLTSDQSGIGGRIKVEIEDFRVDEVEARPPAGRGQHLLLKIRKRSCTSHEAASRLARALKIREAEVGFAGIKDARAVTTQWMSVPASCESRVQGDRLAGLEVIEKARHDQKLRSGQLAGNRFEILIRGVKPGADTLAREVFATLSRRGVPNYFGPQRFGTKGDSDLLGRALFLQDFEEALRFYLGAPSPREGNPRIHAARHAFEEGDLDECEKLLPSFLRNEHKVLQTFRRTGNTQAALARIPKSLRLLFLSAYQSRLFNACLDDRLEEFDRLLLGDVAIKLVNGAAFVVNDPQAEQPRADSFEISPAGPLFGAGLLLAGREVKEREEALFAAEGVAINARSSPFRDLHMRGERRAYRFPLQQAEVAAESEGLRVRFELPRGCYATTVLAELMKAEEV